MAKHATHSNDLIAPLWKQTMLLIVALFPSLMLEAIYIAPFFSHLNVVLAKFINLAITVSLTSTLFLPVASYSLYWWLHSQSILRNVLGIFSIIILYAIELSIFNLIY